MPDNRLDQERQNGHEQDFCGPSGWARLTEEMVPLLAHRLFTGCSGRFHELIPGHEDIQGIPQMVAVRTIFHDPDDDRITVARRMTHDHHVRLMTVAELIRKGSSIVQKMRVGALYCGHSIPEEIDGLDEGPLSLLVSDEPWKQLTALLSSDEAYELKRLLNNHRRVAKNPRGGGDLLGIGGKPLPPRESSSEFLSGSASISEPLLWTLMRELREELGLAPCILIKQSIEDLRKILDKQEGIQSRDERYMTPDPGVLYLSLIHI